MDRTRQARQPAIKTRTLCAICYVAAKARVRSFVVHRLHSVASDKTGQWNSVRLMLAGMNILYYSLFGGDM